MYILFSKPVKAQNKFLVVGINDSVCSVIVKAEFLKITLCFENIISGRCLTVFWAHQLHFLPSTIQMLPATELTPNVGVNAWHESLNGSVGGISSLYIPTAGYAGCWGYL